MGIFFLFKWMHNSVKGLNKLILLNCFIGILRVVFGLLFVWICKQMIDIATQVQEGSLFLYSIFLLVSVILELSFATSSSRIEGISSIKLKNRLKSDLFSHLMNGVWSDKHQFHSGDIINRLEEDIRLTSETLSKTIPSIVIALFQILGAFLFLYFLNATMAYIILPIMPIFLILSKLYINRIKNLTNEIRKTDSDVQSLIQESIQHKTVIQTLEAASNVLSKLFLMQAQLYEKTMKRLNFSQFSKILVLGGFATGYITIFIWGVYGIDKGILTFGILTAFLQLVGQVQRPIVDLSQYFNSLSQSISSIERLKNMKDIPIEKQGDQIILKGKIGIQFKNVKFSYSDQNPVLDNFSCNIKPGDRIAIKGESGIGKTTLMRLILDLIHPQEGTITLYNNDVEMEVSALTRSNIIYVPQGNTLFSGTIRENLLLAKPSATDDEIKSAIWISAAEFVYSLPNGLNTFCRELGVGLSEGQAQRICIARGLLRSGKVLLLDEFSSALDEETEKTLLDRLTKKSGKTLVFVTHRDLITRYCNQVLSISKS